MYNYIDTFPPMGHPEHHFNKYPEHPWLKTKDEIIYWMLKNLSLIFKEMSINDFNVNDDLTVTLFYDIKLSEEVRKKEGIKIEFIPLQIRKAESVDLDSVGLKSLIGSPYISDYLTYEDNSIESFRGFENSYTRNFVLDKNKIKSFEGLLNSRVEYLSLVNNPIKNWRGLSDNVIIDKLFYWELNEKKDNENIIMNVPEGVKLLMMGFGFESAYIKYRKAFSGKEIDMEWLRKEQKKIKDIISVNNQINGGILIEDNHSIKKRKI